MQHLFFGCLRRHRRQRRPAHGWRGCSAQRCTEQRRRLALRWPMLLGRSPSSSPVIVKQSRLFDSEFSPEKKVDGLSSGRLTAGTMVISYVGAKPLRWPEPTTTVIEGKWNASSPAVLKREGRRSSGTGSWLVRGRSRWWRRTGLGWPELPRRGQFRIHRCIRHLGRLSMTSDDVWRSDDRLRAHRSQACLLQPLIGGNGPASGFCHWRVMKLQWSLRAWERRRLGEVDFF